MIADFFYGRPSHKLRPIGITGTNGKTTTTYLIEQIWRMRRSAGVIGTIETRYGGQKLPDVGNDAGRAGAAADFTCDGGGGHGTLRHGGFIACAWSRAG